MGIESVIGKARRRPAAAVTNGSDPMGVTYDH